MDIRILGAHNCELKNSRLVSLLVDDRLIVDAGGITSSLSLEAQLELKAILLTHQHYDHIRDIPSVAMNFSLSSATINIYSIPSVYDVLITCLLNGKLYPKFLEQPRQKPAINFTVIEPGESKQIAGYDILALPVNHSVPTVGYQITAPDGKVMFFTGDTGIGLTECWERVLPQLLITEITAPDSYEQFARQSGHLTPSLLKQELTNFRSLKSYLPQVVVVHMNPRLEREIGAEVAEVARVLGTSITLAYEGMQIHL